MHPVRSLFAVVALSAFFAVAPAAQAADQDFNGRWDIKVNTKAADFAQFTTTAAWWLQITGAGMSDMKIQFIGPPDGALDNLTDSAVKDGVLHFTWIDKPRHGGNPNPNDRAEYQVKYINGRLQGAMTSPATTPATHLTFTGYRAPEINEHDNDAWVKATPSQLFDGKDLKGWTGVNSPRMEGWSGLINSATAWANSMSPTSMAGLTRRREFMRPVLWFE